MSQSAAVFLVIALSLLAANLPFLLERPLLVLPWSRQGSRAHSSWSRWTVAALLLAALAGTGWLAQGWIGQAVVGGGAQAFLFLLRVLAVIGAAVALLAVPGWYLARTGRMDRNEVAGKATKKTFLDRFMELLALYALVGALGVAFEANLGSVFPQGWAFYAVTFSLFLVMAYPGFVARYLFKRKNVARR